MRNKIIMGKPVEFEIQRCHKCHEMFSFCKCGTKDAMNDLEYVIWFLLSEKKFEIEFRLEAQIILRYWDADDQEIYALMKIKTDHTQKLHEFVLLLAMEFERDLRAKGVLK